MDAWSAILIVVGAYTLGSVDFGVLISRARGVDIYSVGSGNPGASNVLRIMGKGPALAVLAGDISKGAVAAAVGLAVGDVTLAAAAGFFAVLGHCFPVFYRFHGGKGMATAAGMMVVAFPLATLILLVGWLILVLITRVASVGSLAAMLTAVPLLIIFNIEGAAVGWMAATAVLVITRHRANILRLARRSEATIAGDDT